MTTQKPDNPLGVKVGQRWRHSPSDGPTTEYVVRRMLSVRKAKFFAQFEGFTMTADVHLPRMTAEHWAQIDGDDA